MKFILVIYSLSLYSLGIFCQSSQSPDDLYRDFQDNDWTRVYIAKTGLENLQVKSMHKVIELLDNDKSNKLINTGDLIYPGADKFYGHGQIINYDIDNLDIRAGWLLEQLTFQNFGFSLIHDNDENIPLHLKNYFPEIYKNLQADNSISSLSVDALRSELKEQCILKAKKWYNSQKNWTRFDALKEALTCDDTKRQVDALLYLRTSTTKCDELSPEKYRREILPLLKPLAHSSAKRVSEQAKFILNDGGTEFLIMKQ